MCFQKVEVKLWERAAMFYFKVRIVINICGYTGRKIEGSGAI